MKHIYYFIGICYIIYELLIILSPIQSAEKYRKFYQDAKNLKDFKDLPEESKGRFFISLLYLMWFFVGLFTFNWFPFLLYIIYGFVIVSPLTKLTLNTKVYPLVIWVSAVIGALFTLFVILNSYHLKIDLFKMIW